ncbi:hypothetical protein BU16DRAFT_567322 [Lophium mytilinum]|uniref:Protein kinase domain-containing protein n=1 Tax=Lophium mytilinum TaxID=390894 RepID=A0A6A6Q9Q1_9PEZI|nr:hypothetical protein BU16DRAFT_567322 [Lophium mytilinum]
MTRKYMAPERALRQPTGRSEDIFALGCTYLQMAYVLTGRPLQQLEDFRVGDDRSFQANLKDLGKWVAPLRLDSSKFSALIFLIEQTLIKEPGHRPSAREVVAVLEACNNVRPPRGYHGFFGDCCYDASAPNRGSKILLEVLDRAIDRDNSLHTRDNVWGVLHQQYEHSCAEVKTLQKDRKIEDLATQMQGLGSKFHQQKENFQELLRILHGNEISQSEANGLEPYTEKSRENGLAGLRKLILVKLKTLESTFREEFSKVKEDHVNEKKWHHAEIADIEEYNEEERMVTRKRHERELESLHKQISNQQRTQSSTTDLMKQKFDAEIRQLKQVHMAEIEQLRQEISSNRRLKGSQQSAEASPD